MLLTILVTVLALAAFLADRYRQPEDISKNEQLHRLIGKDPMRVSLDPTSSYASMFDNEGM